MRGASFQRKRLIKPSIGRNYFLLDPNRSNLAWNRVSTDTTEKKKRKKGNALSQSMRHQGLAKLVKILVSAAKRHVESSLTTERPNEVSKGGRKGILLKPDLSFIVDRTSRLHTNILSRETRSFGIESAAR